MQHVMTFTPPSNTPYQPFNLTVAAGPGTTNITAQIQAVVPQIGINLGILNAPSVATDSNGNAIPGNGSSGGVSEVLGTSPITVDTADGIATVACPSCGSAGTSQGGIVSSLLYGLYSFGDSNTNTPGGVTAGNFFPDLLWQQYAPTPAIGSEHNLGVGGTECFQNNAALFANVTPADTQNPPILGMYGTNEYSRNTTPTPSMNLYYQQCDLAFQARGSISSSYTVQATNTDLITPTGTWTADSTFTPFPGLQSAVNGSTLPVTLSIPTGTFYVFYGVKVTSGGTFTVPVDGANATDTVTQSSTLHTQSPYAGDFSGQWVGLARFVTTPGNHSIAVNVTSATAGGNDVHIYAIAYASATQTGDPLSPRMFKAGVLPYAGNPAGDLTTSLATGNMLSLEDATLLASDGLPVVPVDIRKCVDPIVGFEAVNGFGPSLIPGLHLQSAGQQMAKTCFATAMNLASVPQPTGANSVAATTGNATIASSYTVNQSATAGAAITYSLPVAANGKGPFTVANSNNGSAATTGALKLLVSDSSQFIIFSDGTETAAGGSVISSGAAGDAGQVIGVDATHWQFFSLKGSWSKSSAPAADTFVGASGSSPSANWTIASGTWQLTGSNSVNEVSGGAGVDMWWNAGTFTSDQFSQFTMLNVATGSPGVFNGPSVRHQTGSDSYYAGLVADGVQHIFEIDSGSLGASLCTGGATITSGDVFRLNAVGSTLTLTQNGTSICSGTSSTYTGGSPGLSAYDAAPGFNLYSNWTGGNGP